jgi:L-cysteine:1D-myo-inositol 2-amino-2-deoxy-alpha-D-glucopyranoside ligase
MRAWADLKIVDLSEKITFPQLSLTDSASLIVKPLVKKDQYRMYVCGITPYDATHLGHAATYLSFDLIHRYLLSSGFKVKYVQNITDIDEPLLERASRDRVEWNDLASQQIQLFREDMSALRVIPPVHYIGAIESIPLVSSTIEVLERKKTTYEIGNDLYFSISQDDKFSSISHLDNEKMIEIFAQRGGDPSLSGKKDPLDCLVWMSQRPNEPGWPSSHGFGRPGWHIECTAIAMEFLEPDSESETLIDIQGGGNDLIFPHHEMCASQARMITGRELASHYVHAGMIGLDGEKMSKSKGNLVFVSTLLDSGIDPFAIRWALMQDHYRSERMWTDAKLMEADVAVKRLRLALKSSDIAPTKSLIASITVSLSQDLDTPSLIHSINMWVDESLSGVTGGDRAEIIVVLDNLLGLALSN